jgi:hypothetical protein
LPGEVGIVVLCTGEHMPGEPLASWLARVQDGRDRVALLEDSPDDDVDDPMGGSRPCLCI